MVFNWQPFFCYLTIHPTWLYLLEHSNFGVKTGELFVVLALEREQVSVSHARGVIGRASA